MVTPITLACTRLYVTIDLQLVAYQHRYFEVRENYQQRLKRANE